LDELLSLDDEEEEDDEEAPPSDEEDDEDDPPSEDELAPELPDDEVDEPDRLSVL
jgi:hypothetical protein